MFDEINDEVEEEALDTPEDEEEIELDDVEDEDVDTLRSRLAKAEELANNYKVRAEKAEKGKKAAPQADGLTTSDILAITRAQINEEDLDEVLEYAKFKKTSVSEALKSSILRATLAEKSEERTSAQAVNTGGGRRANNGAISDERLMADAAKGMLPDSDADIARIARLRLKNK